MNLKRDNWTNDEVISLLESCRLPVFQDGQECGDDDNFSLNQAICLFYDLKADPNKPSAKALDIETGRVVCIGPKLPQ